MKRIKRHMAKHHKVYIVWWFWVYGLIKAIFFVFTFFAGYSLFGVDGALAANVNSNHFSVLDEDVSDDDIWSALFEFFGGGFGGLLTDDAISEMEERLFGWENPSSFAGLSMRWNSEFVRNSKILKDVVLRSHDDKIKVNIKKNTKVKKKDIENELIDYEWELMVPVELDVADLSGVSEKDREDIKYAFEIWSTEESLVFENSDWSTGGVAIVVELDPDEFVEWQKLLVKSSDDWVVWDFVWSYVVEKKIENSLDVLFVSIDINHATIFTIVVGKDTLTYNFFVWDEKCDEISETTNSRVNLCFGGENLEVFSEMKFSTVSYADLAKQKTIAFSPKYAYDVVRGKNTTIYVELSFGEWETVQSEAKILFPFVAMTSVSLSETKVEAWKSVNIDNNTYKAVNGVNGAYVSIGGNWMLDVVWWTFDGDLIAPAISKSVVLPTQANEKIWEVYSVWSDAASLIADGVEISVFIPVSSIEGVWAGEDLIDKKINVKTSNYGSVWEELWKYPIESRGEDIWLWLDVSHLSYFGFTYNWHDNDDFVDAAFWENGPTDAEIVNALYGTSTDLNTAYTQNWDGYDYNTCLDSPMNVSYESSVPSTIAADTIYVLASWTYSVSSSIDMADCSAMISSGDAVILKTASIDAFNIDTKAHVIVDSVDVDGNAQTLRGYYIADSDNVTFNNIEAYSNYMNNGVFIHRSNNCLLSNSQVYNNGSGAIVTSPVNNGHGVVIQWYNVGTTEYNIINNTQVYNNVQAGIWVNYELAKYNTINNSQIYNNGSHGIWFKYNASNGVINNTQSYSNGGRGVSLTTDYDWSQDSNFVINNSQMYNNVDYGLSVWWDVTNNEYYGSIKLFGNGSSGIWWAAGNIVAGNSSTYASLWWDAWSLDTSSETMWYEWITRARDSAWNYGPRSSSTTQSYRSLWTSIPQYYSYGNNILKQIQPVKYNSSDNIELSDIQYDNHKYIAQHKSWSNEFFLTQDFWDSGPSDEDIIWALYGDGDGAKDNTAYTEYWSSGHSNDCSLVLLSVESLSPGTDQMPPVLLNGVTYVLKGWEYQTTSSNWTEMGICTAIVWVGDVKLTSSVPLDEGRIQVIEDFISDTIVDNVKIDGIYYSGTNTHVSSSFATHHAKWTIDSTLNKIIAYNNDVSAINMADCEYCYLTNSEIFNNNGMWVAVLDASSNSLIRNTDSYSNIGDGFHDNWDNSTFDNIKWFNNGSDWFSADLWSDRLSLNNSQFYSNSNHGVYQKSNANPLLNNVYSYNNWQNGFALLGVGWPSVLLNDVYGYNNWWNGISISTATYPAEYHGTIKTFDNVWAGVVTGSNGWLAWVALPWLWWDAGVIDTMWCMTCDWYSNPQNNLWSFLMNTGDYELCDRIWYTGDWVGTWGVNYLYGSLINKQQMSVEYNGSSYADTTFVYDDDMFIAENNSLWVYTGAYACNCDPDGYFWWNNDEFVTQADFWDQNPSQCDIVVAFYGTGAGDETAYTQNWSWYDGSCSLASGNMNVEYYTSWANQIYGTLDANTIHVLSGGSYVYNFAYNSAITVSDCNAIVWDGDALLYTFAEKTYMIYNWYGYFILDNVGIDWISKGSVGVHDSNGYWLYSSNSDNNTINNSQIYNNNNGIYNYYSAIGKINNSQIYNNNNGIYNNGSRGVTINNSQIYNNSNYWVVNSNSYYNILNNSQIYNNNNWLYNYYSNSVIINNSQIYNNNNYWIFNSRSNGIVINNSQVYSDWTYWISMLSSIWGKYYGELSLFDNWSLFNWTDGHDSVLSPWSTSDYPGLFDDGYLTTYACMSCAWVTNPINQFWDPLLDTWAASNCAANWANSSRDWTGVVDYEYGEMIKKQDTTIVYDSNNDLEFGTLSIDSADYIAEINNIWEYVWGACDCSTQTYRRENDNFITWAFWDNSPTYCDIIVALYGTWVWDETAYTSHRSGYDYSCSLASGNMNVEYMAAWNGNIPNQLDWNTIYVLSDGDHLLPYTNGILMSGCNWVVWNGDVYMYSTWKLLSWMINSDGHEYGIIDNVSVDGLSWHTGGSNKYGIYFNGAENSTINMLDNSNSSEFGIYMNVGSNNVLINNTQSYDNTKHGVRFTSSLNWLINDSQSYGNGQNWFVFNTSSDSGTINNSQSYSNGNHWVNVNWSDYVTVNNSQIYNNAVNWISFVTSVWWVVENSQSYNNNFIWINFDNASHSGLINNSHSYNNVHWFVYNASLFWIINDSNSYNNSQNWIVLNTSSSINYYGVLRMFDNWSNWYEDGWSTETIWSPTDAKVVGLSRTTWSVDTVGCMTCDWYTNPINSLDIPLMNTWDYSTCERKWYTWAWISTWEVNYIYWSLISKQTTGIYYTGWNLEFSDLYYDPTEFIAEINNIWEVTTSAMCNCDVNWTYRRENDNFITWAFWNSEPTYCDVIVALYGTWVWDETAYTSHRSGYDYSCSLASGNMNVEWIDEWNGNIPNQLDWNTIYVLSGGDYLLPYDDGVQMSWCNWVVWNGDVSIYSTWRILAVWMINNDSHQYGIIDNVKIDGLSGHTGGENKNGINFDGADNGTVNSVESYNNDYWVYFLSSKNGVINNSQSYNNHYWIIYSSSANGVINNSQSYNNNYHWIVFSSFSTSGVINNSQSYNNYYWIVFSYSANGVINNSQSYNNNNHWIYFMSSINWIINNSQSYNNNNNWIYYFYSSNSGVINNSQSYNNGQCWIYIYNSSNSGVINNSQSYNNGRYWIYIHNSLWTKYYGEIKLFDNVFVDIIGTITTWHSTDTEVSGLWRLTWEINTIWCMTCDWYTNPINSLDIPLMNTWDYSTCERKWYTWAWISTWEVNYIYWSLISKQTTGIYYTGWNLEYSSLFYDPTKYIAEVNLLSVYTSGYACNDACFGVVPTWDNSNFITGAFWDTNPTDCEIIAATYGTGEWDDTAYTDHWDSSWTGQCNWNNMDVVHVDAWTDVLPNNLDASTIYVLKTGEHLMSYADGTNLDECTAVVWEWDVVLNTTAVISEWMINNSNHDHGIVDNVRIDGLEWHSSTRNRYGIKTNSINNLVINNIHLYYHNNDWIYLESSKNVLLNNSQIYNNFGDWLVLNSSNYWIINNSQIYNNADGWISIWGSNNNTINNSQIYNNFGDWLVLNSSNYWIINNSQIYNNADGWISIWGSNNNTINNSQIYNNDNDWIYYHHWSADVAITNSQIYNNSDFWINFYGWNSWVINNVEVYNNDTWVNVGASFVVEYYGELKMFENWSANINWTISSWAMGDPAISGLWRLTWEINTDGCMTCDWYSNPQNSLWNFLIDTWTDLECTRRWYTWDWISTWEVNYLYGSLISKQTTGVYYTGWNIEFSDLYYDPTEFIAEINSLGVYTGGYSCNGDCTADGNFWRDNDEYLTQSGFWDNPVAPTYCDIIVAVYGTWVGDTTPYTENWTWWTNQCNIETMAVEYISTGVDMMPENLTGNTIYVLDSGHYNFTYSSGIFMSGCNVILWKDHVYLHSADELSREALINNNGYGFDVLDNLNIDGIYDWNGDEHSSASRGANNHWIEMIWVDSVSFNNLRIYNNNYAWLRLSGFSNILLANSQFYKNKSIGIDFLFGDRSIVDNVQSYNQALGVNYIRVDNSVISNSQFYNNGNHGIRYKADSNNNLISNSSVYNNYMAGIYYNDGCDNNIVYSVNSFNNQYGVMVEWSTSTWNKYYNTFGLFNSYIDFEWTDGHDSVFTWWLDTDAVALANGWTAGVISDMWQCMNCTWITNPINPDGTALIDTWIYSTCDLKWAVFGRNSTGQNTYIYGTWVKTQTWVSIYNASDDLMPSTLPYTLVDYIAERYKVWEYIDTGVSCGVFPRNFLYWTWSTPVSGQVLPYNYFDTQIHIAKDYIVDFDYMFSGTNYPATTYDIYDSGLVLMMNFDDESSIWDSTDATVVDLSMYANTGTVNGATYVTWGKRNWAYSFDGSSDYITITDDNSLDFTNSLSIWFWIKPNDSQVDELLTKLTDSWPWPWSYEIYKNWTKIAFRTYPWPSVFTSDWDMVLNEWNYVMVTWDGIIKKIYINWLLDINTQSFTSTLTLTNGDLSIGAHSDWNYSFAGDLDEVRMYDRALSQDEVQMSYRSNLNKYDVDDWNFEVRNTCLAVTGVYQFSGYADAVTVRDEIGRTVYTDIPAFNVTWMIDYDFGTLNVSSSAQVVTWWYTGYIEMHDWRADTGWYTTVQFSDVMTWLNNPANMLSWENFEFAYSGLVVLSWFESSYVSLNTGLQYYTGITLPFQPRRYMERDHDINDFMCNAWVYGDTPQFELTIPAYQAVDTYSWVLTVDINY